MDATPDRNEKPRTESFDTHAALMKDAYPQAAMLDASKIQFSQLEYPGPVLAASAIGGTITSLVSGGTIQIRELDKANAALGAEGLSPLEQRALTNTQAALSEKFLGSLAAKVAKGAAVSLADAGLNLLLQKEFGNNIGGHDLFAESTTELAGMGIVASLPLEPKARLLALGTVWAAGRVENYFFN